MIVLSSICTRMYTLVGKTTVATSRLLIPSGVTIATFNSSYLDCSYLVRATIVTRMLATQNYRIKIVKKIICQATVETRTTATSTMSWFSKN